MSATKASNGPPITVLFLDHTAKLSGGEIALVRLIEALDPARVRCVALLAEDGPLAPRLRAAGAETHVLPLAPGLRDVRKDTLGLVGALRNLGKAGQLIGYARRVAAFAKRIGADVLHCNSLKADVYGALAGRMAGGVPVVWHVRDHVDPSYLPGPAVRAFRFSARRLPAYVITNSHSTLERLHLGGARPATVAHSGVSEIPNVVVHDGLGARELASANGMPEWPTAAAARAPQRRVALVGRLAPWKGQHVFLRAAQQVCREEAAAANTEFVLIGSALFGEHEYEARLRRMVQETPELRGRVRFAGFQDDVFAALRQTDVLVHASITPEPFGQVVVEGMALGLPVIATNGGGVREIIRHNETGLLVPMDDAPALADALAGLLADPGRARRLGQAAREHVRAHFTAAHAARKIECVYDAVVSRRGVSGRTRGLWRGNGQPRSAP